MVGDVGPRERDRPGAGYSWMGQGAWMGEEEERPDPSVTLNWRTSWVGMRDPGGERYESGSGPKVTFPCEGRERPETEMEWRSDESLDLTSE